MDNRIRLKLIGLSYNPLQDGAFAMLLAAKGSTKRIPIIIGAAEAQAIAIVIEHIKPQRPMTHDLFATMTHAFGVELKEVFIYSFEDGIFSAEMTFTDNDRTVTLDSRTSDAVAIAIRTGAPIYTTPEILEETGVEFVEVDNNETEDDSSDTDNDSGADSDGGVTDWIAGDDLTTDDYEAMPDEELIDRLDFLIADDNFEEAAIVRAILDRRNNTNNS